MAETMVERPGARKTISAAAWAASVAPSTAIPQSDFFKDGALSIVSFGHIWRRRTLNNLLVDTVTSHGSQMPTLLKHLDDLVLVLWEDFGETISLLNKVVLGSSG